MAKDLMAYLKGGDGGDSATADKPKPDGEAKDATMLMAERVGVENPAALVKLIKHCLAAGGE